MDEWYELVVPGISTGKTSAAVKRDVFNFTITLKAMRVGDDYCVFVGLDPTDASYALMVDYKISNNGETIFQREKTLWCPESGVKNRYEELKCQFCAFRGRTEFPELINLKLEVRPHQMLPISDITQPSAFKYFLVKSGTHKYYVNPGGLSELGGTLFKDWKRIADDGGKETEIPDDENMRSLIECCLRYDRPIVHSNNFMTVGWCALSIGSSQLLRTVEDFVCSLRLMHPVSKIQISAELKLARLFKAAQDELGKPHEAYLKILEYSRDTGIDIDEFHPIMHSVGVITNREIIMS